MTDVPWALTQLRWGASALYATSRGTTHVSTSQLYNFSSSVVLLVREVSATTDDEMHRAELKQQFINMMHDNMWVPTLICSMYILFVHATPRLLSAPVRGLNPVLCAWNLSLSVFSVFGTWHCLRSLLLSSQVHGFYYTICSKPKLMERQGTEMDVWVCFFVLSKVAELFDTVLKVLMCKRVIFLHWYHHAMTCWLGWLAIASDFAPGLWYAAINYAVHAPMYFYFFLSASLPRKLFDAYCRPVAPFITTIQVVQMWSFLVVNTYVLYYKLVGPPTNWSTGKTEAECHVEDTNLVINWLVTVSYVVLFMALFVNKYLRKPSTDRRKTKSGPDQSIKPRTHRRSRSRSSELPASKAKQD